MQRYLQEIISHTVNRPGILCQILKFSLFFYFLLYRPTLLYIFSIYLICYFIYLHSFFFFFPHFSISFFGNASFPFLQDMFFSPFSLPYRSFHLLFISFTSIFFFFHCIFDKYLLSCQILYISVQSTLRKIDSPSYQFNCCHCVFCEKYSFPVVFVCPTAKRI